MSSFRVLHTSAETAGRLGELTTARGCIETPVFMPVGTQATVKAMTPDELQSLGVRIILGNTYHLMLRPGHELIRAHGGLHDFMQWHGPILTDSGGYQIFSLGRVAGERRATTQSAGCRGSGAATPSAGRRRGEAINAIPIAVDLSEEGVRFTSSLDGGQDHFLTPESAIAIQEALGSDIMMVLDECLAYPATKAAARTSMELSLRWATRGLRARTRPERLLFGIIQGGIYPALRKEYVERLLSVECASSRFDGLAIGGLSVGEPSELLYAMTAGTAAHLPAERPRYLMGVGTPEDLLTCIDAGIDMFDCVLPTRSARTGRLYTRRGDLNIMNSRFATERTPLDSACACPTCQRYSRAYLHHLAKSHEILGARLNTLHNLHFYMRLLEGARQALRGGYYPRYRMDVIEHRKEGV
ncbi:MAG: tRNA guanosine(34) transglycosylase Tgt [Deltaproteobacteria bacterium]|nr:tRNA guanosine(34) transglycosylase Tgt [Deltaproteobacteria bacterium]